MTDYPWMCVEAGRHLDRLVDQMVTEVPPSAPAEPFDLAALTRLAAEVESMRPRYDRMVIAPDVKERLLALTTRRQEIPGPDRLWGTPVLVDEDMPAGHWELRDGDRVERRGPEGCRCELCQSGESDYDTRCPVCSHIVPVVRGRYEEHRADTLCCAASGEEAS